MTIDTARIMETVDHISARVAFFGCLGGAAGALGALYSGFPMLRFVGMTGGSMAMISTACFTSERLAAFAIDNVMDPQMRNRDSWEFTLTTHAVGGFAAGALLGGLYSGKPARGMALFVPFMLAIGVGEQLFEEMKQERIQQIQAEARNRR